MGSCLSTSSTVVQERSRTTPTKPKSNVVGQQDRQYSPTSTTTSEKTHKTGLSSPTASTPTSRLAESVPHTPCSPPEIPSTPTSPQQIESAHSPERPSATQIQTSATQEQPETEDRPEIPGPAATTMTRQQSTASEGGGPHDFKDRPEIPRPTAIGPSNESSREISSATGRSTSVGLVAPGAEEMVTTVKTALDAWNLVYQEVSQGKLGNPNIRVIKFELATIYTTCMVSLSMDLEDEMFAVYYTCSQVTAIPRRRREVAKYLVAANYDIMLGHFDLDFRDGELRFRNSEIVRGTRLSVEMVHQMNIASLKTVDKYFPGLMACQFGNMTAEEALEETRRVANQANNAPPEDAQ